MVAGEAAQQEGQTRRAHRHDDLRLHVALHVASGDQAADRDQRVGDAPDRVGEAEVVDAHVAGIERGVDVHHRAGVVGRLPEWR